MQSLKNHCANLAIIQYYRLKEKQAKRKVARADEEKAAAERKKQEEERRVKEIEEKKLKDAEAKKQRLIEAEKKRQAMMSALKEQHKNKTMNLVIRKKAMAVYPPSFRIMQKV